jgi:hypothetical protein
MFIETEPKRAYRNNLLHVRKLFSAYFHKLSIITIGKKKAYSLYRNSLNSFWGDWMDLFELIYLCAIVWHDL